MESCSVNFVHNQMYKVYNHFQNGKKQIGYVETDKLYYVASEYSIPTTLFNAILNKNVDIISLRVKRTFAFSGKVYLEDQYRIDCIIPRIYAGGSIVYYIYINSINEKGALYVSDDYLYVSSNECDAHIEKVTDQCLINIGDKIKTQTGVQRYINKEIDKTSEEFKRYIGKCIKEQEAKKCEETK